MKGCLAMLGRVTLVPTSMKLYCSTKRTQEMTFINFYFPLLDYYSVNTKLLNYPCYMKFSKKGEVIRHHPM